MAWFKKSKQTKGENGKGQPGHGLRLKERAPDGPGSPMVARFPESSFRPPSRLRPLLKPSAKLVLFLVVLGAALWLVNFGVPAPVAEWEHSVGVIEALGRNPYDATLVTECRAVAADLVAGEKAMAQQETSALQFWRKRERESTCAVSAVLTLAYLASGQDHAGLAIRDYTLSNFGDTEFSKHLAKGELFRTCSSCNGGGSRVCTACGGSGTCRACGGRGKLGEQSGKPGISRGDLSGSSGKPVRRLGESGLDIGKTPAQLGSGVRTCTACRGGGKCLRCSGQGKIGQGCAACGGAGSVLDDELIREAYKRAVTDAAALLQGTLRWARPRNALLRAQSIFRSRSRAALDKSYDKITELDWPAWSESPAVTPPTNAVADAEANDE